MLRNRLSKAAAVTALTLAALTPAMAGQVTADETRVTATTAWETAPAGKFTTAWE
ncbi:hypothetical protein OG625_22300 [Streptomyces sp. NBC_01351]|uniref:hypothetical protein n=1 Tax=Streptomyces sp. NBC_01351 TaxID=2903833 RepID=UPI002E3608EA|nr:hypothetical protein [Streptomyces sp. NBC_01351]